MIVKLYMPKASTSVMAVCVKVTGLGFVVVVRWVKMWEISSHSLTIHGDIKVRAESVVTVPKVVTARTHGVSTKPTSVQTQLPETHSGLTHMRGSDKPGMSFLILPVYVSHKDHTNDELITNRCALLDTQSDSTFVTDDVCGTLRLQGVNTQLSLSNITTKNQVVDSRRMHGLETRGHNSLLKLALPIAFT